MVHVHNIIVLEEEVFVGSLFCGCLCMLVQLESVFQYCWNLIFPNPKGDFLRHNISYVFWTVVNVWMCECPFNQKHPVALQFVISVTHVTVYRTPSIHLWVNGLLALCERVPSGQWNEVSVNFSLLYPTFHVYRFLSLPYETALTKCKTFWNFTYTQLFWNVFITCHGID